MQKVGFGGSCHWCTEAIFRSLEGVIRVEQGWISSDGQYKSPSEAVIVIFDEKQISLETLIAVHLHTHSCTAEHSMREKYRSAVYTFEAGQTTFVKQAICELQKDFDRPIITQALPFQAFRLNDSKYLDYYYADPSNPFCQNIVNPKLKELLNKFRKHIASERIPHLSNL